jgi:hypothetical protein
MDAVVDDGCWRWQVRVRQIVTHLASRTDFGRRQDHAATAVRLLPAISELPCSMVADYRFRDPTRAFATRKFRWASARLPSAPSASTTCISTSTPSETEQSRLRPAHNHHHCRPTIALLSPPLYRSCTLASHRVWLFACIVAIFLSSGPFCLLYTRSIPSPDTRILFR